jgi:ribosome-binding protein aMBF1 (putative translation factor)
MPLEGYLFHMSTIEQIVGDNIRQERENLGLSQADLAEVLKIKPQTVYRWEKGKAWPTSKNAASLAKIFGIDPTALFARRKQAPGPKPKAEDPKIKAALAVVCRVLGYSLVPLKGGRRAK